MCSLKSSLKSLINPKNKKASPGFTPEEAFLRIAPKVNLYSVKQRPGVPKTTTSINTMLFTNMDVIT